MLLSANTSRYHYNTAHFRTHCYSDVIMSALASQCTTVTIVYSTVCSSAKQRKHQSSASRAFVRGIHRWSVNFPHKGPVTRKMFSLDDVIMEFDSLLDLTNNWNSASSLAVCEDNLPVSSIYRSTQWGPVTQRAFSCHNSPSYSQWVNSVPPYVRKLHFMYEVVRTARKCRRSI